MNSPGQRRQPAGFTLIEILLVLSISALLLALTPSLLHTAFPVLKLKAAARDLVQEMRYVQNAAIINGQVSEMLFDLQRGEYRSDQVNGGRVRALPSGLSLSLPPDPIHRSLGNQTARFIFYPDGSANGGVLYLGNDRKRLQIRVDWLTSKIQLDEQQAIRNI
jgi:general secretion pathway protein H